MEGVCVFKLHELAFGHLLDRLDYAHGKAHVSQ